MKENINILAIESSCDDTSASVISNGNILANIIAGQEVHREYGGVVPELASRAHQQNIVPVVHQALKLAKIRKEVLSAIAFTKGPGLLGSLLVGGSFAKSFALGLNIPLIEVNHMEAHVMAHFIKENNQGNCPNFPFLCLTVSGGHTQIVHVSDYLKMEVIGNTKDDAAGEAFDKAAKILGLPYPGGPIIDGNAKKGNSQAFKFPNPNVPDFDYSFSGLKTSFLYFIRDKTKEDPSFIEKNMQDICASYQQKIVDVLVEKLIKAAEKYNIREIAIAGGVAANSCLRNVIEKEKQARNWNIYFPKFEYCTDNAAMIAIVGHYKFLNHEFADQSVTSSARYV